MDDLERIIRPIVEGQIRGFLKEHPKIVEAVDWYKPRADRGVTFVNSLAKRIVRDLCCERTRERVEAVLLEPATDTPLDRDNGMGPVVSGGSGTIAGVPE